jgi:hypothetical protein
VKEMSSCVTGASCRKGCSVQSGETSCGINWHDWPSQISALSL